jgi:hypothetical protein
MIRRRLPGSHVIWLYQEMSRQNRCRLERQLCDIVCCLTSHRGQRLGTITAPINDLSSQPDFNIQALDETRPMTNNPYSAGPRWRVTLSDLPMTSFTHIDAPPYQGSFEALIEIFKYRNNVAFAKTTMDGLEADYTQKFITLTSKIGEKGYLDDMHITLCLLDFDPVKILANLQDPVNLISGIMGSSSAVFAPSFMACQPPS